MKLKVTVEKAREQVAKFSQKMATMNLVLGTWGNISCHLPEDGLVVITPSGVDYETMRLHKTVVVNMQGEVEEGELKPSSEVKVHLAVYAARPDVRAIVHTHSTYASALAVAREPIPPILEDMASLIGGEVAVAEYALAGTDLLATNVVSSLGDRNAVLMASHGIVGVGRDLTEAFNVAMMVERCAHIYTIAKQVGNPHMLGPEDVAFMRNFYLTKYGQK
ncbi:class II aldolase/adducin family protein [Peptococcaceae bacterium 1198_IL3148]